MKRNIVNSKKLRRYLMLRLPVQILKLIHEFGEGFSQQKLSICPPGPTGLPSIYLAQLSASFLLAWQMPGGFL